MCSNSTERMLLVLCHPFTGGQTVLALRLLLAVMSSRISSGVNRPFGDEFRAAWKAAEEVGAQIVLGDRPVEITLERAWNSLSCAKLDLRPCIRSRQLAV